MKEDFLIFVPSMSRHGQKRLVTDYIAADLHDRVYYAVPDNQVQVYRDVLKARGFYGSVISAPSPISATRLRCGEAAKQMGFSKFIMLDDDIDFLIRKSPEHWQLRATTISEVIELFDIISVMLDDFEMVSVSSREGNNVFGIGSFEKLININSRPLRVLAFQTDAFLSVEHGRVEVMEDFDVTLQILRKGGRNAVIGYYANGQPKTQAPGGCSVYRTRELHERSAKKLQELHPQFVKLRQKQNKTDNDGFGKRTEVTIQWKKAAGK